MRGILLVQPPLEISRDFIDYPYHSDLAVVSAAAVLREAGLQTRIVDSFALPKSGVEARPKGRVILGAGIDSMVEAVEAVIEDGFEPHLLLLAYGPFNRPPSRDAILAGLVERLRAKMSSTPFLLADLYQGGQHYIQAKGDELLLAYPEVDAVLLHEAEAVLASVCLSMISKGRPQQRWSRSGGEAADLSVMPVPAWDLIDLGARDAFMARVVAGLERGEWSFPIDGRTLPATTSRGCPYECAHCSSNPGRGEGPKTQRRRDEASVTKLVDALVGSFGATRIHFLDEMVNVHPGHLDHLLRTLAKTEAAYDFPNGMRADHLRDEHLDAMRGRITTLSISAESGAERVVREVVGKRLELSSVERVLQAASERSLPSIVHFIIGMPEETAAEINETLELAIDLRERFGAHPAVQFATPLPGTRLFRMARVEALADHDWCPVFQHRPLTSGEGFGPDDLVWFKWTFERRLEAMAAKPKLIVNLTYRCNNRCVFCAVGNRTQIDGSFDRQKEILATHAKKGMDQIDLDGGEPTLYPRLVELIRHARSTGFSRINVTTNGRMCAYEAYAKRLVRSGLSTMLFSLHGDDARSHAASVGVPEAFEQTIAGIRNCVRHRPEGVELGLNVTVTNLNETRLPGIARLAHQLGLAWINFQFLTPFGRATRSVSPNLTRATEAVAGVIDEWGDRLKIQVVNLPFCFMPGYEPNLAGDLLKLRRDMVFVDNQEVNLYDYLAARRFYEARCGSCRHRIFCGGLYRLEDSPEPPWVIDEEDVGRPLSG